MEKRISLNKIPKEEKDRIIKTRPRVIALIEEVEETNMNQDKAPQWFTEFADKQEKFNESIDKKISNIDQRVSKLDQRINKLEEYHK